MSVARWQPVLALLQDRRFAAAVAALDRERRSAPLDGEALILRAVASGALDRPREAEADLWRALAIDPAAKGARAALGDLFVRDIGPIPSGRDFTLGSGERQTAEDIAGIREDHRLRYDFAARRLRDALAPAHRRTGIDAFCGNGYGARILADRCGCRVVGVDGSAEAVALAERAYGGHRVVFRQAYFPFELAPGSFDFAVCFESIEHVDDCDGFLAAVDAAVRGPLLLSFPLESGLPFAVNADLFRHHVRHFAVDEMATKLARLCRRRVTAARGQKVYRVVDGRVGGVVDPSLMGLGSLRPDSQFAVVVAERE